MTWQKTPADRQRDAQVYGDPEYKRNKAIVRRRSGGRCEVTENGRMCGSTDRVQCDHIKPVSQGGTHHIDNLRDICRRHHAQKTAQEGGGYRKTGRRGGRREADPVLTPRTRWLPPVEQMKRIPDLITGARTILTAQRATALAAAEAGGAKRAEIARQLGISRQQITKIAEGPKSAKEGQDGAQDQ